MSFRIASQKRKRGALLAAFEDEEEDTAEQAVGDVLKEFSALKTQGENHAAEGRFAAALACWDRAVQLKETDSELHEMRAQALNELGRTWEALQAATKATSTDPGWPAGYLTLARCQLNYGEPDHQDALAEIQEVRVLSQLHKRATPGQRAHVQQVPAKDGGVVQQMQQTEEHLHHPGK